MLVMADTCAIMLPCITSLTLRLCNQSSNVPDLVKELVMMMGLLLLGAFPSCDAGTWPMLLSVARLLLAPLEVMKALICVC